MNPLVETLRWQFRMTWSLASLWIDQLDDDLLLWAQTPNAVAMRAAADGAWVADWDDEEPDPVPPATSGWLTWHMIWWWSSILDSIGGSRSPDRSAIEWVPDAARVTADLHGLAERWTAVLTALDDGDLERPVTFPWLDPRPLRTSIAWVNSELMKNAAELGDVIRLRNGLAS